MIGGGEMVRQGGQHGHICVLELTNTASPIELQSIRHLDSEGDPDHAHDPAHLVDRPLVQSRLAVVLSVPHEAGAGRVQGLPLQKRRET